MPDAVLIVAVPSLETVFTNRYADTITEQMIGRPAKFDLKALDGEVLRPDGRPYARDEWPIMRATRGEKVAEEELRYRRPDGSEMSFRISSAPVYDLDRGIVAAVAVWRDVTVQQSGDSASLDLGL